MSKPESIQAAAEAYVMTPTTVIGETESSLDAFKAGVMWERKRAKNLDLVPIILEAMDRAIVMTDAVGEDETPYHGIATEIAKHIADAIQKRAAR
jgi:hypothetical protein